MGDSELELDLRLGMAVGALLQLQLGGNRSGLGEVGLGLEKTPVVFLVMCRCISMHRLCVDDAEAGWRQVVTRSRSIWIWFFGSSLKLGFEREFVTNPRLSIGTGSWSSVSLTSRSDVFVRS